MSHEATFFDTTRHEANRTHYQSIEKWTKDFKSSGNPIWKGMGYEVLAQAGFMEQWKRYGHDTVMEMRK